MYLYIWYRATWPRYRFDQLMRVGWKVMLPISLGVLIVTAIVGCYSDDAGRDSILFLSAGWTGDR